MVLSTPEIWAKVKQQKIDNPAMYGDIDFDCWPERLLQGEPEKSDLWRPYPEAAKRVLANKTLMERIEGYTFLGDSVADAYAALTPQYGFRKTVDMLMQACDKGIEAVEDAPPELVDFIAAMEAKPDWVDMDLVEEGARLHRNGMANVSPWAIRGSFIATFLNKYAALPMALTGTLSHATAARRIKETATFFATSVLPGALQRYGAGFHAAAMVRLMHSMVRFNVLSRGKWDQKVYGIPIPQVDQMPAGLISDYFLAMQALREGRQSFNHRERAQVELSRYRCFLLGLPEDLLADTPQGIVDNWNARIVSLRSGYDENTCGVLLKATMDADLADLSTPGGRTRERFERSFSKLFFIQSFCLGSEEKAASFGVKVTAADRRRALMVGLLITGRLRAHRLMSELPVANALSDRILVSRLVSHLGRLGHAHFESDGSRYKPSVPAEA